MYPGNYASADPARPAFIMAGSGETVTYEEYEARTNRLAHLLRALGLKRLDHYSIFMENHPRYLECCGAGERAGLYYTCVNSYPQADEVAYVLDNRDSRALITSRAKLEVAREAAKRCPKLELLLVASGARGADGFLQLEDAVAGLPATPIADEWLGTPMLYSSGTAPLYHSAPQAAVGLTLRCGGAAIIVERFDPEHYLSLIGRYRVTHTQLVPTMFSRMLKLPENVRRKYDLSSLEVAIHHLHDHLRRGQRLPARVREPADHPPRKSPTPRCSACRTRTSARK